MKIRVVNWERWNRAKRLAQGWISFICVIIAVGFAGGMEGTDPAPSAFWAFVFIAIAFLLMPRKTFSSTNYQGDKK